MKSDLAALGAVLLWASLATIGASLSEVPPLLLTGLGLLFGSLISIPLSKFKLSHLKVSPRILAVGIFGLFGYHFALFAALQNAPPVQANLINYLWPLLIVLLSPVLLGGKLTGKQIAAAAMGFSGAALAITSGSALELSLEIGYVYAAIAAMIWAIYSLLTKKFAGFKTAAVGTFAFTSGLLAIASHFALEPATTLSGSDWLLIFILGIGPLGGAFYLWDYALKNGSAQRVGLISFATPLLSTIFLIIATSETPGPSLVLSAGLIVTAAFLGRERK